MAEFAAADEMLFLKPCTTLGDFMCKVVTAMSEEMFFLMSCTNFGDYMSKVVIGMADKCFFLMCTNLGDSMSFIKQAFTFNMRRKYPDSRIVEYGCWHELRFDLMEMILHNSDVTDHVQMRMVCKSWESILNRKDIRVAPQFPWLLLPHDRSRYDKKMSFYDMSRDRFHDVKLPKWIHGGRCLGSSKGWLVMVKGGLPLSKAQIYLFNPISGAHHKLPSLQTLPCFPDKLLYHFFDPCFATDVIYRIELSSEDPSNCIVATIIHSTCHMLAFCRVGGQSWSIYEDSMEDKLVDILFSNNEILYVLKLTDQESVATYSFISTDYQVCFKIIPLSRSDPIFNDDDDYVQHLDEHFLITRELYTLHLAQSNNGHLLLIRKMMDTLDTHEDANEEEEDTSILKYNSTSRFDIHTLDLNPDTGTSCMTKLASLGNHILFFSQSSLSFVQAGDFTGFKENCIYFIEDFCNNKDECEHSPLVTRESGIFYLDDGRIERFFPSVKLPLSSYMGRKLVKESYRCNALYNQPLKNGQCIGNFIVVFLFPILMYYSELGVTGSAISTCSVSIVTILMIWYLNKRVVLMPPKIGALQFGGYLKSGGFLLGRTLAVLITMTTWGINGCSSRSRSYGCSSHMFASMVGCVSSYGGTWYICSGINSFSFLFSIFIMSNYYLFLTTSVIT